MGPVLLQEQTGVPGENLRCLVEKQDNTVLTYDQGNFNQITTRSRNRTLVTIVRDTCTATVPPAPHCRQPVGNITAIHRLRVFHLPSF